ncbi:MAG: RNA polymerase factor sigma-54 [Pseudomonadota bacterium]
MGDLKLNVRLSQQLIMTPQLQQAIKLLQLSRLELQQTITNELMENPVLEEVIDSPDPNIVSESEVKKVSPDDNWQEYVEGFNSSSSAPVSSRSHAKTSDDGFNIENIGTRTENLYDHLTWQLKMSGFTKKEEEFGEKIIQNINDDGYLLNYDELVKESGLTSEEAEEVLLKIQEFDPVGIASRDVKECLLQQVRQLNIKDGKLVSLIKHHLSDLEKKNYQSLARKLGVSHDRCVELAKIVLSLEPKPGRAFSSTDPQYVIPDIYVLKVGNDYIITMNDDGLPRLRVSSYYKNMVEDKTKKLEEKTKDYLQDKLRGAVALIRSIQHRQKTIYKVTEAIVKKQLDFLEHGVSKLRPMILREIAQEIGMHESTVSRVTTNKYVHTPQGLFELKFFFNNPVSSKAGSDDVASEAVRSRIKELISKEDTKNPYSDQQIVEELKKHNIDVARRTIAKYRDMLRILPSNRRKKHIG